MTNEALRCHACGEYHQNARFIKTQDGRQLGLHSEEYRRYTEAKWVLGKYRSKQTRQRYLADIQSARGQAAAIELRQEMLRIWTYRKERASQSQQPQTSSNYRT